MRRGLSGGRRSIDRGAASRKGPVMGRAALSQRVRRLILIATEHTEHTELALFGVFGVFGGWFSPIK
jgi:hypothetical protein